MHKKVALISNNRMKNYTKTEPGLVAFYDSQPGDGAGVFLQPQACREPVDRKTSALTTMPPSHAT